MLVRVRSTHRSNGVLLAIGMLCTALAFAIPEAAFADTDAHHQTADMPLDASVGLMQSGGGSNLGGDSGFTCVDCQYHNLYILHLPAARFGTQLQWRASGGTFVPLRFRLEYCRIPGSDCDTVSGNLLTDGTIEVTTPPGLLPFSSCPTNFFMPIITKLFATTNFSEPHPDCAPFAGSPNSPCFLDTDWSLSILERAVFPDGTKCLWRIGLNQHSDADALFTQHNFGACGVGDFAMTLNRPWEWLYGETQYCYRYQFQ